MHPRLLIVVAMTLVTTALAASPLPSRHIIYLHGRIVQEQQSRRPEHPRHGAYELDAIAAALGKRGADVEANVRAKNLTVEQAAEATAAHVRQLIQSGRPPERITVVGASMGASIALRTAALLQEPEVRFALLGPCISANVPALANELGAAPAGRLLAIREETDVPSSGCASWSDDPRRFPRLRARELVLNTGLEHGFLYRPLPEWVEPVLAWSEGDDPVAGLPGGIYRLAELNTEQIRGLNRARTAVLMPGGVLEQHGPYLPSFTDGYMNEWWTERLAEAIVARPGWSALIFPMLPLGDGGANEIGGKYVFPGSYGVRVTTLRAVYMDLATELGEQGFRWVFVLQNHGSPMHNLAIDQAGDYFRDVYGGQMVNLSGLEPTDAPPPPPLPEGAAAVNGVDIHAGLSETSRILFLRPDLVDPRVAEAPAQTARTPAELGTVARRPDWPGYFGAPHLASAAYGAAVMRQRGDRYIGAALQILDGRDSRSFPRYATTAMKAQKETVDGSTAWDEWVRKKQEEWLRKNGIE